VSTHEVRPLDGTVGQKRGLEAIALGLALQGDGFTLYIAGGNWNGALTRSGCP
jgi:hypothetical protein